MQDNFLVTRTRILVPRRRPELLSRPRLVNALMDMLVDNKLIIVAAPAGYGKTSLLIDIVHHIEWPVCWYALDPLDQDPLRFAAHFITSLQLRFPNFGANSMGILQSMTQDRLNLDLLLAAIINDVYENITEHFIFVLDDYHLVDESKPVNQFVSRFIQDVDENCHLMIASRTLISLPDMTLLVARSQVGGLSFEELAFRQEEIQELLLQNQHLTISDDTASELARQTEGWVTGLLLSAQLLGQDLPERQTINRVSGVNLYEYLTQQVFDRQPPAIQDFLLRTSLLEEFDASFCAEVINPALRIDEDWEELMSAAMRNNLFILPVEDERIWLRYHHLFSDFLQTRITRQRPEEAAKIQLYLAEVYARRGQWEQVYRLYQRLGRLDAIVSLIEEAGLAMVTGGKLNTLSTWLRALPESIFAEHPALISIQGSVAVMGGDTRRGLELFNQAIDNLSQTNNTTHIAQALVWRSGTHRMLGEYTEALADAESALWRAGRQPAFAVVRAEACRAKGVTLIQQGQYKDALTWLTQSEAAYRALGDGNNSAKLLLEIGMVHKASGNLAGAEQAYARALEHWEKTKNSVWQSNLHNNLGVLQHMKGDYVSAASSLERAIQHAKISSYPRMEAFALTSIGDMYRDLEALQEAMEAYRQALQIAQRIKDLYLLFYLELSQGVLARMQNETGRAAARLESAHELAMESGSQSEQNLCRLETGVLHLANRECDLAVSELETALDFFSQQGQQVETGLANLYLALSWSLAGDFGQAASYFSKVASLVAQPARRPPLVTAGRDFKLLLIELRRRPEFGSEINDLLVAIDAFEQALPGLRNQVRRRASVVPFAPPRMVIRTLGKIEVKIDDHIVTSADWLTQIARDLFFFILAHPDGLSKEMIGTVFWPDSSPAELKLRFKNVVYRLRHAAGRDVVLLQDEIYRFNTTQDYEYDVEMFQKEIELAQGADDLHQRINHSKAAINLYKGPYLPEVNELWAITERGRLHQLYMDTLVRLGGFYLESGQLHSVLEICQTALREDPCLESAHRLAMRFYAATGNRAALVRQYELCKQALKAEFNANPSPQTEQLYDILTH